MRRTCRGVPVRTIRPDTGNDLSSRMSLHSKFFSRCPSSTTMKPQRYCSRYGRSRMTISYVVSTTGKGVRILGLLSLDSSFASGSSGSSGSLSLTAAFLDLVVLAGGLRPLAEDTFGLAAAFLGRPEAFGTGEESSAVEAHGLPEPSQYFPRSRSGTIIRVFRSSSRCSGVP